MSIYLFWSLIEYLYCCIEHDIITRDRNVFCKYAEIKKKEKKGETETEIDRERESDRERQRERSEKKRYKDVSLIWKLSNFWEFSN